MPALAGGTKVDLDCLPRPSPVLNGHFDTNRVGLLHLSHRRLQTKSELVKAKTD